MSIPSLNIEINALINGLQDLARFQQELGNTGSALQSIAPVAGAASSGLTEIQGSASNATGSFGRLGASTTLASTQVGSISTTLNGAVQNVNNFAGATEDLTDVTVDLGSTLTDVSHDADLFGRATSQASDSASDSLGRFGDNSVHIDEIRDSLDEAARAASDAAAEIDEATAEVSEGSEEAGGAVNRLSLGFRSFAENAAPDTAARVTDLSSGLSDMREQAGSADGRVELLGMGLGKLAGLAGLAAGAIVGIIGAISLKEAVEYAARLETMNKVMRAVGNNAGYSSEKLDEYEKQITDLGISSIAAKEAIAQMASAGLELGDVSGNGVSQVAELAEAAQNLSIVAGTDASEALSNLIINVKQLDTEGLRNMGIVLDQAAAQDQYAEKVGKSAGALTNAEKQQAAMNYVLGEASKLSGVYAASLDTLDAKLNMMGKAQDNLSATLGQALLPAYKALVGEAAKFLVNADEIVSSNVDIASSSSALETAVASGAGALFSLLEGAVALGASIADEVVQIGSDLVGAFSSAFNSVKALFTSFSALNSETNALEVSFKLIGFAVAAIADGFKVVELGVRSFLYVAQISGAGILDVLAKIASFTNEELSTSLKNMANEMREAAEVNSEASKQIVDDFGNGETALGKFTKGLLDVKKEMGEIGTGNTFAELSEDILTLTSAQRQGIISSSDLSENLTKIKDRMKELGSESKLTEAETAKLNGSLAVLAKDIATEFNDAIKNMGLTVASLSSGVSDEVSTISGSLLTLSENAQTTGGLFNQAFNFAIDQAGNITELSLLTDASANFAKRVVEGGDYAVASLAQLGEATLLARGKFEELFDAQLGAARTQEDFKLLTEQVQKFGEQMVQAGLMSEEELGLKLQLIAEQAEEVVTNLREVGDIAAFEKLGLDVEELKTGFSSAFNDILDGFDLLAVSSTVTSETMGNAFEDVFDGVENVKQLNAIQAKLQEAAESGVISGEDLAKAGEAATDKFNELFKASLEAANTSKDFEELRAEITAAGDSGVLSAEEVAKAFEDVQKKVDGASVSVLAMAEQARELSNANLAISNAQTAVLRAQMDSTKAEINYQSALNTYREDGTEQSRLDLEVRKIEMALAKERVELAKIKQEIEEANYDMLISKQQALNAEKRLELDINNAALISAADAATKEAEAKALVVSQVQNAYVKQEMVVGATERAALQAQSLADKMRQTATNAGAAKSAVDGVAQSTERAATAAQSTSVALKSWGLQGIQGEMRKYIDDMREADRVGKEIYETANTQQRRFVMSTGIYFTNYGFANKLMADRIEMLKKQEEREQRIAANRAEEAQRVAQRAAAEQQAADLKQQALDALATSQQQYVDKLSAETDKVLGYASRVVEQAQYLADTGGNISSAFSTAAKEGMSEAAQQIERMKDGARDLIKNALDAGNAFLQSTASLDAQLLQAQGKEAELLEVTQKARRANLETEYELLKVKLQIAKVTADQAGVDSTAISEMINKANAAYTKTQATLQQLEQIETKQQQNKESQAIQDRQKAQQAKTDAYLKEQSSRANQGLRLDATPDTKPPVNHVVTIQKEGAPDAVLSADSENVDNILEILQNLKSRSA